MRRNLTDLKDEERAYLESCAECTNCKHVEALHSTHCCEFCYVPGCKCGDGNGRPEFE